MLKRIGQKSKQTKEEIWIGSPPIHVLVRRNLRSRRYVLRYSSSHQQAFLTAPVFSSLADIQTFAESQKDWLKAQQEKTGRKQVPEFGAEIPILGTPREIVLDKKTALFDEFVTVKSSTPAKELKNFLKKLARERFLDASRYYADELSVDFNTITLKDTRTRWGSCSTKGNLNYSWRLAMAPENVLNYVAAHEVCHLKEMNHSKRFWDLVASIHSGYKIDRLWLRQHGAALHLWDFDHEH